MKKPIEELLEKPCWIIDILPMQVPSECGGQFFAVERWFLRKEEMDRIKQKHIRLILKLNCYHSLSLDNEEEVNPAPDRIAAEMKRRYLYIRIRDSIILSEPDDTHMTVFDPDRELLQLIQKTAPSEGLYVWKP